ncbi:hypothetical protein [Paraglaciecola sp.]|uniref:hypothetical protein n=1 Tax=Paraglaciecola sp. TaxID=1920173 RepID=UPI003EF5DAFE
MKNYSFTYQVDQANQILICEAEGELNQHVDMEYMFKNMVKLAGKERIRNIVLDVTALRINCTSIEISHFLMDVVELDLMGDIKIARITSGEQNSQNIIAEIARKLSLSIRNFETRSEALIWLLFDTPPK